MFKCFRNYTPFIYKLIIFGILPFAIIAGEVAMVIYIPFLPYEYKKSINTFMRFQAMCPMAMVYTIVIADVMVFKGIFSKENRFEAFIILSEEGKKVVKKTILEDAILKNIMILLSVVILLVISVNLVPDMYTLTGFRVKNGISLAFHSILLTQVGTWVVRHFLNWTHLLWVMSLLYTVFVPLVMGMSLWDMSAKVLVWQAFWALMATALNVITINKKVKKNWSRDY